MLGRTVKRDLVSLAKTLRQFTIGRDKCSTSGAPYRFVVVQYPRITESKASPSWATELRIWIEISFNVVVEIHDLVYRHGVLDLGPPNQSSCLRMVDRPPLQVRTLKLAHPAAGARTPASGGSSL